MKIKVIRWFMCITGMVLAMIGMVIPDYGILLNMLGGALVGIGSTL